jgi:hypothetical protein
MNTGKASVSKDFEALVQELPYWTKVYGPSLDIIEKIREILKEHETKEVSEQAT